MSTAQYFKPWITQWNWGVRIILFIILLSSLIQFGTFALTQNYVVSQLGAQPEEVTFAIYITYVGILATLPVQFRFVRYFETRNYLIVNILAAILLSVSFLEVRDIFQFFILRFIQGVVLCNIAGCMLAVIFSRLTTERMQAVGSSVFYGAILSSSILIGLVDSVVVINTDWRNIYYYVILFQLVALVLILLAFRSRTGFKPYPLYQVDWVGSVLFIVAGTALAYTMIYGSKFYWLADERIRVSASIASIGTVLFVCRELTVKRPLINLAIFQSRNFIIGLILLAFYYGAKDSVNLIYNYAGGFLQWSTIDVMKLGLCNVAGLVTLLVICAQLMIRKRHDTKAFLLAGFGVMLLYHLWIYFILTPDLSFYDLAVPVFLQGAASGLLLVPIIIFMLSSAPSFTGTTGVVIAGYTRFSATLNSIAGFYNLQLYFNQYYKEGFLGDVTQTSPATTERLRTYQQLYQSKGFSAEQATGLANAAIGRIMSQQSQLLTIRAVFMTLGIAVAAIWLLVLFLPSINNTYLHWNKRMFVSLRRK